MVRLVPMTENEYEAFLEKAIPEYAAENVKAGYWSEAEALKLSGESHQRLLPQGIKTAHNYLFSIQIEETGEKIGILWLKHEAPAPRGFIFNIRLDEAERGKGCGKQAMLAIETVAKDLGIETIGLHVFAHNPAAMQLYKNLGYEVTSQNMVKQLGA